MSSASVCLLSTSSSSCAVAAVIIIVVSAKKKKKKNVKRSDNGDAAKRLRLRRHPSSFSSRRKVTDISLALSISACVCVTCQSEVQLFPILCEFCDLKTYFFATNKLNTSRAHKLLSIDAKEALIALSSLLNRCSDFQLPLSSTSFSFSFSFSFSLR